MEKLSQCEVSCQTHSFLFYVGVLFNKSQLLAVSLTICLFLLMRESGVLDWGRGKKGNCLWFPICKLHTFLIKPQIKIAIKSTAAEFFYIRVVSSNGRTTYGMQDLKVIYLIISLCFTGGFELIQ